MTGDCSTPRTRAAGVPAALHRPLALDIAGQQQLGTTGHLCLKRVCCRPPPLRPRCPGLVGYASILQPEAYRMPKIPRTQVEKDSQQRLIVILEVGAILDFGLI